MAFARAIRTLIARLLSVPSRFSVDRRRPEPCYPTDVAVADLLSQAGGAIGTIGTALSGYLLKRVLKSAENADSARDIAAQAKAIADALNTTFVATRAALRLELDSHKQSVDERLHGMSTPSVGMRTPWPSRPDLGYDERVSGLLTKIEAVSSELKQERDRRVELERLVNERNKEDIERWLKLERTLGNLETLTDRKDSRR